MYCAHFGLHRPPFNNTPDPGFYFGTPEHDEALATLEYATLERKGFVLVTGEIGAGKTLIGRMFLRRVETRARTAVITHTHLSGCQLLAALCAEFDLPVPPDASNLQLAERLQRFLLEQYAQDRLVVVLLDEAQNLPDESFEAVRMLGNLEADDAKLIQICILGQPELKTRFEQPSLRQLDQRLFRRFHLGALTREQTAGYIHHRLSVAGWKGGELFTAEAIDRIAAAAQGTPRLINRLCDNALLTAYGRGLRQVDAALIEVDFAGHVPAAPPARSRPRPWLDPVAAGPAGRPVTMTEHGAPDAVPVDDAGNHAPPREGDAFRGSVRPWLDSTRTLTEYRRQAQAAVAEVAARCDALRERLNELAAESASAGQVRELRELYEQHVTLVRDALERQRAELIALIEDVETRQAESRNADTETSVQRESTEEFRQFRACVDEQVRNALERIDALNARIETLAEHAEVHARGLREELDRAMCLGDEERAGLLTQLAEDLRRQEAFVREEILKVDDRISGVVRQLTDQIDAHESEIHALKAQASDRLSALSVQVQNLETRCASTAELERVRSECGADIAAVIKRIDEQVERLAGVRTELVSAVESGALNSQKLVADQAGRLETLADELRSLGQRVAVAQTAIQDRMELLTAQVARSGGCVDELQKRMAAQQSEMETATGGLTDRLNSLGRDLALLREHMVTRPMLEQVQADQVASLDELRNQQTAALEASRQELDALQAVTRAESADIRAQLEGQRNAMQGLIDSVVCRCRAIQERLEALSVAKADTGEVAQVARRQEQLAGDLLERLNAQKEAVGARLDEIVARWEETAGGLNQLATAAASTEELAALRAQQEQDIRRMVDALATQRGELEALLADVDRQCAATAARLASLPDDLIDAARLEAIQCEHAAQIRAVCERMDSETSRFDAALAELGERCRQAHEQLEVLATRAASTDDVAAVRESNARELEAILRRLDRAEGERQRDLNQLNQRWDELADGMRSLAARTTSAADLAAIEKRLQRDLNAIRSRLDAEHKREQSDIRTLVRTIQQFSARLTRVEEAERPAPVKLELTPDGARELSELIECARRERQQLADMARSLTNARGELADTAQRVQQSLESWREGAAGIEEKSTQLRASAGAAGELLQAMQKARRILDAKINSHTWQAELARGEALAGRLERAVTEATTVAGRLHAALRDFDRSREEIETWNARCAEARQLAHGLARLLAASQKAGTRLDTALDNRKQVLHALARNTAGLVDVIEAARRAEESPAPRPRTTPRHEEQHVSRLDWPRAKAHPRESFVEVSH